MQHLVVQHVFHHVIRHACAVKARVDHDLIQPRIEASKLRAPFQFAPSEPRPVQPPAEIIPVQPQKHRREIVSPAHWPAGHSRAALASDGQHLAVSAARR